MKPTQQAYVLQEVGGRIVVVRAYVTTFVQGTPPVAPFPLIKEAFAPVNETPLSQETTDVQG